MKNLLTDVAGVAVGHAQNDKVASGTTAIMFDRPVVAAMDVRGGGPGVRDAVLLDLVNTVETIDGFALSGGSAHGLEAGGGIQAWLTERGRGFRLRDAIVPLVTGAIVEADLRFSHQDIFHFQNAALGKPYDSVAAKC